jgi:hypothetical protein
MTLRNEGAIWNCSGADALDLGVTEFCKHSRKCKVSSTYRKTECRWGYLQMVYSLRRLCIVSEGNVFTCARHEGVWESEGVGPLIFNRGTNWRIAPRSGRRNKSRCLRKLNLTELQRRSGCFGEEKTLSSPTGIRTPTRLLCSPQPSSYTYYTVPARCV